MARGTTAWPRRLAREGAGPLGTLLGLVVVELVTHGPLALPEPLPVTLFLAVLAGVVVSTYLGGVRMGLLALVPYALYTPRLIAEPGTLVDLSPRGIIDSVVVFGIGLALVLPTAYLRRRDVRLQTRLIEAERARAQALEARNHELAATNRVLTDFSHVVSHDLKEPVRAMDALLQFIQEDESERLSPSGQEMLRQARRANERLAGLVEALLEYSRATRIDPSDLRSLDVGVALQSEGCRTRFAHVARERDARIEPPARDAPPVLATEGALCLILGNLVLNAMKHNPRPRPLVRILARPGEEAGFVEVAVEDDGAGFSAESLARVREALEGRENPMGIGRGGFGLVIVARAAERLGGRIRLGTSPEGGACVTVMLPTARGGRGAASGAPPPDHARPGEEAWSRARSVAPRGAGDRAHRRPT